MLWSKVIYYRTHKRTGNRQIRRMMKKRNIHDAFQISSAEAKWRRKVLRRKVKGSQKDHATWRTTMQYRLMEARAKEKKTSKVAELKAHKQNEKQR